jgi:hypothetical protein
VTASAERSGGETPASDSPAAGWYPDPENPDSERPRWWDGERWTDAYAPVTSPSTAAWVGAAALLAIPGVLTPLRSADRGETSAYAVGSGFGAVFGSLLFALLIRFIYVKVAARQRQVWSPWTLVIAAVIGLLVLPGGSGG